MNADRALSSRRRSTVEPRRAALLDDAAHRRLVALACAYGLAPDAAALAVERAVAAAAEPWTRPEAAARRRLLDTLRRDPTARRPALGGPERLRGPLVPADASPEPIDWADVPAGERAVVAGALFDGLDLVGLARALATHRLDVKARARRVLSRLAGEAATGSGLAAVRHMMAGEYALGLVPPDAFAPFQRGLALDPGLQALVAGWDARFAPLLETVAAGADAPPPAVAAVPVRPPPPAVPSGRKARGAVAIGLVGVALLGVGTAAWFARSDATRRQAVLAETLPAPRRAVAADAGAVTASVGGAPPTRLAAASSGERAPSSPAAPVAALSAPGEPPASDAVMAARRASAQPAREVTAAVTVHVHHRAGDPAVAARAAALAATLRGLGATVELMDADGVVVSADRLRFFVPDDAPAARLLVDQVPGVALQDFTHYVPQPAPGMLELWVASEAVD